ncbi:hypothetical protein H5410_013136 [Solanum commersonii]|uniref:Uncharacterized protein n=1 Tax=Solanum commersonii TaxID=4109 RepID=A0A9J6ATP1_SOLCO|nr:hypothetical protein H5410_013136 [Solanum commersonii]
MVRMSLFHCTGSMIQLFGNLLGLFSLVKITKDGGSKSKKKQPKRVVCGRIFGMEVSSKQDKLEQHPQKGLKNTPTLVEFAVAILNFHENLLPPQTI